jgi:hypothetical protein
VSACIYKYYTSLKVNPAIPVGASSLRQLVGSTPFGDFSKSFQKKLEYAERQPVRVATVRVGFQAPLKREHTKHFLYCIDDLEERESLVSKRAHLAPVSTPFHTIV